MRVFGNKLKLEMRPKRKISENEDFQGPRKVEVGKIGQLKF